MTPQLRAGTRHSLLAKIQTRTIVQALFRVHSHVTIHTQMFSTVGDQTTGPLPSSHPGVFTSTLEAALMSGEIDFAVHSLKDLPVDTPKELTIAAIPPRSEAHDVLVTASGLTLRQLPKGTIVHTSSLRRAAQLLSLRSDLKIEPLRGNVHTRVDKVLTGKLHAIVLAEAGLSRLGISHKYQRRISMNDMLPAPAQGALAVECRKDDHATIKMLQSIDCTETRDTTTAERSFLACTGGGCSFPIGAYAKKVETQIHLRAEILSLDGLQKISVSGAGSDPVDLGYQLAQKANQMGAKQVLSRD